jgi:hypothetical protein
VPPGVVQSANLLTDIVPASSWREYLAAFEVGEERRRLGCTVLPTDPY